MTAQIEFVKGHGAGNDFVLVPDPEGSMAGLVDGRVAPSLVRSLCNRRTGIGADGLLRIVRTTRIADGRRQADEADWFMDYYNADGSIGEMCGNGTRVFARYLAGAGMVDQTRAFGIGTRAGVKRARFLPDGSITVDLGVASVMRQDVTVQVGDRSWPAASVDVGNPHLVVAVDDVADAGALVESPHWTPADAMPEGANVEFVQRLSADHIRMRVFERGVGETQACGTGAVAAALVSADALELPAAVLVDTPGGRLQVTLLTDGHAELAGPAELVYVGSIPIEAADG